MATITKAVDMVRKAKNTSSSKSSSSSKSTSASSSNKKTSTATVSKLPNTAGSSAAASQLPNAANTTNKPTAYNANKNTGSGGNTIKVDASGNARAGTAVGTIVETAGGNYQVVAPGTAGASYNPASGLWSKKVTGTSGTPASNTGSFGSSGSGNRSGSGGNTIKVDSSGNAPTGTAVGTIVETAGGNYQVVAPGTAGASYNPVNGLWSVKVTEANGAPAAKADGYYANTGAPGTGYLNNSVNQSQSTVILPDGSTYTPTGSYFDAGMSQEDLAAINALKQAYSVAQAAGDIEGMQKAHSEAQVIRAKYGYSGGTDGSERISIELPEEHIPMQGLPIYEAQTEAANSVYDAALKSAMAALESAYEKSRFEAEAAMGKIPAIYQQQANAIAANAEKERQAFNEFATASGLNSGTGSQASLAMSNALQNDLGAVRTAEANAISDAQNQLTLLYIEYQNGIAEAIANNEYERAAALLAEYQMQANSVVSVAQAQAALNMDTWGYNQNRDDIAYERLLQQAETLASFGDFSGYLALGFTPDEINNMRRAWKAANNDWAYAL